MWRCGTAVTLAVLLAGCSPLAVRREKRFLTNYAELLNDKS
jgi:hypothetical protein